MPKYTRLMSVAVAALVAQAAAAQAYLPEAQAAIDTLRKSELRLSAVGLDPTLPARLRVVQRDADFNWGTVVRVDQWASRTPAGTGAFVPDDLYHLHFLHFNSVTPGNAGKWKLWERASSRRNYLEIGAVFDSLGVRNRGHGTIWPSISRWNAVPQDVVDLTDSLDASGAVALTKNDRIRRRVKAHIQDNVRALASIGVYELDLVNELVHVPDLETDVMGLDRAGRIAEHAQWYRWAKEANPDLRLVANEYDLFQNGNDFHLQFVAYVRDLLAAGAPIDAVGMQGHFFGSVPGYAELKRRLDQVAALGLPMSVTEFDMDGAAYDDMRRVLYAVYAHPSVYGFTVWGAWDGQQWRGNAPVFYPNWRVKPSGEAYFDLVRGTWRPDTTVTLDGASAYAKTLNLDDGTYDVYLIQDGRVAVAEATLARGGTDVAVNFAEATDLPTPALEIGGDLATAFPDQPIELSVSGGGEVTRVVYADADGRRIVGLAGDAGPFVLTERFPRSLSLTAEVTYASGLRLTTEPMAIEVVGTNAPAIVEEVLPASGSSYLARDGIVVQVKARDPDGDRLVARLRDADGAIVATDSVPPFAFALDGLAVGANVYTIELDDGNFAVTRVPYQLRVFEEGSSIEASVSTLTADDDVDERDDGRIDAEGDIDLGEKLAGVRFLPGIPAGAVIDSAFVQFVNQKDAQTGAVAIEIAAEASGRPAPFTRASGNVSRRALTSARVVWSITDPWTDLREAGAEQRTPDLAPVIREAVAHDDYEDGAGLNLVFRPDASPQKRSAYAVDQDAALAPVLTVYFRDTTPVATVASPTGLSFAEIDGGRGSLTWGDPNPTPAPAYEVAIDGEDVPRLTDRASLAVEDLEPGVEYVARVRALGRYGVRSAYSVPLSFAVVGGSGVGEAPDRRTRVFPNPATDDIAFGLEEGAVATQAEVYDSIGRRVLRDTSVRGRQRMSVRALVAGTYTLRLTMDDGEVRVATFVKQ